MSWRPKDWNNPYYVTIDSSGLQFCKHHDCFEAGADAMLEAIIKLDSIAWKKFLENNEEEMLK